MMGIVSASKTVRRYSTCNSNNMCVLGRHLVERQTQQVNFTFSSSYEYHSQKFPKEIE